MGSNLNSDIWFVCKFCKRAYTSKDRLVQHKIENHAFRMEMDSILAYQKNNDKNIETVVVDVEVEKENDEPLNKEFEKEDEYDQSTNPDSDGDGVIGNENGVVNEEDHTDPQIAATNREDLTNLQITVMNKRTANMKNQDVQQHLNVDEDKDNQVQIIYSNVPALVRNKVKRLACNYKKCPERFSSFRELVIHKRIHKANNNSDCVTMAKDETATIDVKSIHTCDKCSKTFEHLLALVLHKRSHTKFDSDEVTILKHLKPSHANGNAKFYVCDKCPRKFTTPNLLAMHTSIHKMAKKNLIRASNLVGKINSMKKSSQTHVDKGKEKTKKRAPNTKVKVNDFKYSIQTRKQRKTSEKSISTIAEDLYSCDLCPKQFARIATLTVHKMTHTSGIRKSARANKAQNNIVCKQHDIRQKQLPYAQNLKAHQRVDKGEKFITCSNCKKTLIWLSVFEKHSFSYTAKSQEDKPEVSNSRKLRSSRNTGKISPPHDLNLNSNETDDPKVNTFLNSSNCNPNLNKIPSTSIQSIGNAQNIVVLCQFCKKKIPSKDRLNAHLLEPIPQKPFKCKTCGQKFKRASTLKTHTRTHTTGETPYVCRYCKEGFKQMGSFNCHMRKHKGKIRTRTQNKDLGSCLDDTNKNVQPQESSISNRNQNKGEIEKPFSCNICQRSFSLSVYLNIHLRTHSKETKTKAVMQHICIFCREEFSQASDLQKHSQNHFVIVYTCPFCKKIFSKANVLKRHLDVHLIQNKSHSYVCNICQKKFKSESVFQKHMEIHDMNEVPHICHVCQQEFLLPHQLERHYFLVHENSKRKSIKSETYKRKGCNLKTEILKGKRNPTKYGTLKRNPLKSGIHKKGTGLAGLKNLQTIVKVSISKKAIYCNLCKTGFSDPSERKLHLKTHSKEDPWKCNHCQKSFATFTLLRSHTQSHHPGERDCLCHICKTRFRRRHHLDKHLLIHTNEKPFKCDYCRKKFRQKHNLELHLHRIHKTLKGNLPIHTHEKHKNRKLDKYFKNKPKPQKSESRPKSRKYDQCRVRDNEKPLFCKFCQTGFFDPVEFKNHLPTHSGRKLYVCNICKKSFSDKKERTLHAIASHKDEKRYLCNKCNKVFSQRVNLITHMTRRNKKDKT